MSDLLERLGVALAGQYAVERELGRGGMATVFLARDLRLDRAVAVKVLHADLAQALGADRFRREIEIATRLSHPNILPLYDSGDAGGLLFYVMPFVTGESLRDRLKREQQLGVEDAVRITCEVAAALDYAHRQGVVHRDVKPENILLEDGHAVVADFGIARAISASQDGAKLTQTGVTLGTPMYMSPEQACAERDIDGRSDQYSLAAVAYEMLAGQPPFVGPTAQAIIARQMLDQVPSLTVVRKTVPPDVEDALLRALSKVKADRFPTVGAFADALANPGAGTQSWRTLTRATSTRQRAAWSPARRRAVFAAWAIAFLGGGGGLGYAGWKLFLHPGGAAAANAAYAAANGMDPRHVAVLYFSDESKDKSLGYLADGLTEGLIDQLSQVRTLDVASRGAASAVRPLDVNRDSVRDSVAHALKVGTLVTGKVEEAGRGYKVTVRLVDALSGADFAHKSFDAPKENVLGIRDTVTAVVADFLRERLGDEVALRELRSGTHSADAWALVQRAERTRKSVEDLIADGDLANAQRQSAGADTLLARAEALDPAWVQPTVLRGALMLRLAKVAQSPADVTEFIDGGLAHAGRALARDPKNADALELRGSLRYLRYLRHLEPDPAAAAKLFADAEQDLKLAVAIAPNDASAWQVLSHLYYQIPNFTEAKIAAQRAYEEDAYLAAASDVLWRLYTTSYDLAQFTDADHWCSEGHARFPKNPRFTECRLWMLSTTDKRPDVKLAWQLVDTLKTMTAPQAWELAGRRYRMAAAAVLARAGLADSARHVLVASRGDQELDPSHDLQTYEAFVRGLLGDKDEAFRLLRSYIAANPEHAGASDNGDSWWWRPLRSDPRFKELRQHDGG